MLVSQDNGVTQLVDWLRSELGNNSDLSVRVFQTGNGQIGAIMVMEGLCDQNIINQTILPWVLKQGEQRNIKEQDIDQSLPLQTLYFEWDKQNVIMALLDGKAVMILDGMASFSILGIAKPPQRSVTKPEVEKTVKGPQEGFVEELCVNLALVRKLIKNKKLCVKEYSIGKLSETKSAILYLEGIAQNEIVNEVESRLLAIQTDVILSAETINHWIEDNTWSVFPLIRITERPDVVAASLAEGKVVILVDHSPFALAVPLTFSDNLQNMDDYYEKWQLGSAVRLVRFFSVIISLMLPGMYVALAHYNPGLIPTDLLISMISARTLVPFPVFWELMLMEITIEIFREAGIRLPQPLGQTVGIVGGIVIGDAAVRANLVSPITLIIIGLTTMASFSIPTFSMAFSFRFIRFILTFCAVFLGLYGFMLGMLVLLVHVCSLKSFGVSYLSPLAPTSFKDWKDQLLLFPLKSRNRRPSYLTEAETKNKWRPLKRG